MLPGGFRLRTLICLYLGTGAAATAGFGSTLLLRGGLRNRGCRRLVRGRRRLGRVGRGLLDRVCLGLLVCLDLGTRTTATTRLRRLL
ncbi:hypothetical protein DWW58_02405 [Olsenella sp. AF16-14LB]|nr:hypothetical protein DXD59_05010 [Olsenella sp. TM06-36]RGS51642.1 hypothetical protein DWX86_05490 [Olsenella sp. AF21-51]RGU52106.1 hypothetical protein DWW58_02405 [Olsenella sp. AF16-14LB]RGU83312.1 hypothetical protein DWW44_02165 [Olsenella sp. AF15-43LB]RHB55843.1 hypothetical protein DW878_05605 [Olsenella sp. AM39-30AC]RHD72084.1 hypothetical protein DW781_10000 [Olsenella sp. AM30-3LB]RHJ93801.1 hypothetical protein DW092_06035 [Olsenella sp. AM05-7]RHJ99562.1 hypothetical prote